jgi:phosphoribosyl 1,2-cyclic phosphodiesterase
MSLKLKVWGARGSVPAPGPEMNRYGGNTSCVQLTLRSGERLILDAGTGIRTLGIGLAGEQQIHILLTHLHLDHVQGLMFFPPCFREDAEITIWGPASPEASLEDRIARYISAPLSPVEIRELPCSVSFQDTPATEWELGSARIRAEAVTHRGPTLGYRISDGDTTVCYIPDHEPALGAELAKLEREWISGFDLARDADLLIHDCQYTDDEYPLHVGWGHSALSDTLTFARRVGARRLLLFHHDPLHSDDFLDRLHIAACERWERIGGNPADVLMAAEGAELEIAGHVAGDVRPGQPVHAPMLGDSTAGTSPAPEVSTAG